MKTIKRENRWRYWKARAEKAEAELARLRSTPQTDPQAGDVGQEEEKKNG